MACIYCWHFRNVDISCWNDSLNKWMIHLSGQTQTSEIVYIWKNMKMNMSPFIVIKVTNKPVIHQQRFNDDHYVCRHCLLFCCQFEYWWGRALISAVVCCCTDPSVTSPLFPKYKWLVEQSSGANQSAESRRYDQSNFTETLLLNSVWHLLELQLLEFRLEN